MKRKFPSMDKPLRIQTPPKISPSKRAFEKYKPRGLFSEFYGISNVSLEGFHSHRNHLEISKQSFTLFAEAECKRILL